MVFWHLNVAVCIFVAITASEFADCVFVAVCSQAKFVGHPEAYM